LVRPAKSAERILGADNFVDSARPANMIRPTGRLIWTIFLLLSVAVASASAADLPRPIVSSEWLAAHLNDQDLVLLHVGSRDDYESAHIPGARLVSLDDISTSDHSGKGLMLELPVADKLRHRLAGLGITDHSTVIVYFGTDWVSPATRIVFTLDAAGLGKHSALLDGGLPGWVRDGHATSVDDVDTPKGGVLSPLQMRALTVDAEFVQKHLHTSGYALVDGRSRSYYDGVETGGAHGVSHKTGHIVGAASLPFTEVTGTDLLMKSPEALRAMFDAIGVKPGDTVIGYCHIGQQATAMLFAARLLGHPVLLYDGSFEDWSLRDLPAEVTAAR
jgi:thiosulfate/3-mercaptopyruvate sulfurtransferase